MKKTEYYNKANIYCVILRSVGCIVSFKTKKDMLTDVPVIKIIYQNKMYHFSDPDWKVVISQLDRLTDKIFVTHSYFK